ncbi:menaquinone biosynthesis protein [Geobacter pelophilus]|uniref:Chorismate dehydratase n=1 Tax=Geoanaerobacter pelophilus TaxID=60036 RepID=A0AAW4LCN8_9BACT|nr:menaquinone biosynthesis protein [Geoanaerobacter pelophilus]MBT0665647.1 menaquinone biosynthesis protein [Geoanaerobacter pelophilus]
MSLRVGRIEYANCVPLFKAFDALCDKDHRFVDGVPAILNAMLSLGEIDLSPSSSIAYGKDPNRYWLLPGLSISATGPVRSVLLFTRQPLEELDGATIGLTNESDTSVALLKIILGKFLAFKNSFQRTDALPQQADSAFGALLLIGNQAMRMSMTVSDYHVYDLGELWHRFTGLPFVYALWVVNRQSVAGQEDSVIDLARTLQQAKVACRDRLPLYVKGSGLEWYGFDNLISYWQTISYDLGELEMEGLRTFYRYSYELGIIEQLPEIVFFPGAISGGSF